MKREKRRGLRTQPCGVPVFKMRVVEARSPILKCRGLLLRKSNTHAHSEVPRPNCIKCRAKIHEQHPHVAFTLVQVSEGCVERHHDSILCRPVCSICKMMLVKASRDYRLNAGEDEPLRAFHDNGGESNWAVVVQAVHYVFLGSGNDGG